MTIVQRISLIITDVRIVGGNETVSNKKSFSGKKLDAFLEDVEADEMQTQERAEFIRYLISRGMFEKAYLWVRRYGSAGVNPKSLARLISKTIVIKKYEYDEFLVNVSYYIVENMKFDAKLHKYLKISK